MRTPDFQHAHAIVEKEKEQMSKWRQIRKTKLLREKRNPVKRIERITELRRQIKHYKDMVDINQKAVVKLERDAKWARSDLEYTKSKISELEKELVEYESYESKGIGK